MRKGFNAEIETNNIITWIRAYFKNNGGQTAIIGISGGKDSTIIAKLCVEALGNENVYGVLMPNGYQADIEDSHEVVNLLSIRYSEVDIREAYLGILKELIICPEIGHKVNSITKTNIPPRLRMTALYGVASMFKGGRVVCTGNASEEYVGYSTKWGDGCGDFAPLFEYTVSEIIAIGDYLGLPKNLIHKVPADGLSDLSDEDNLGFTYDQLEQYMTTHDCGNTEINEKIRLKYEYNVHKTVAINLPRPYPTFIKQRY